MELKDFFVRHPKAAMGFSGGTDSAYLLYEAVRLGVDLKPYFIQSAFQPAFEQRDARRLCGQLGVELTVLTVDILSDARVAQNDERRCYYCKQSLFAALISRAKQDGYDTIIDGTNASDDVNDRPGYAALQEMQVLSPLRECGVTKAQVRARSRQAGLFTAQKPSYACLATRVQESPLTPKALACAERCEDRLWDLGYRDFRVRCRGRQALVQIHETQMEKARREWEAIFCALQPDFEEILLDETPRRGGD